MTLGEFQAGWQGGKETSRLLYITEEYCQGYGVDFGCELDPHPNATVLVDNEQIVHNTYMGKDQPVPHGARPTAGSKYKYHVHIRNIERLFPDWEPDIFDFTYSSHLIEHIRDPRAFIAELLRLTKPNGNIVIVGPHKDWYWPTGHPDANPDHKPYNQRLDQDLISKWIGAVSKMTSTPVEILLSREVGWDEGNWSFVVVAKKLSSVDSKKSKEKDK